MKKTLIIFFIVIFSISIGFILNPFINSLIKKIRPNPNTQNIVNILPKPLEKYSIEELAKATATESNINIEREISKDINFTSYLFSINLDPTLKDKNSKKVTGLLNLPNDKGEYPVILMLRGYVDQTIYKTGVGTQRAGEYFSNNGFITIAPDFLGYGESDKESDNIFETRFQTYTTALVTLNSIKNIPEWDGKNIFIWGHSNGGQIALTLLEITQREIPTVLWAPVSKPFPYSILYYTDESEDLGKLIRKELSIFEENYDVNKYSIHSYFNWIKSPLQIHQGTYDDAVPIDWTNSLVKKLEELEIDVNYYKYPADHNLQPSWNLAVQRSLSFFISHIK